LREAIFGLFGVFVGACVTACSTIYVAKIEAEHQRDQELIQKQGLNIENMAFILAQAPRVGSIIGIHTVQTTVLTNINKICQASLTQGRKIESCEQKDIRDGVNTFNKEIFEHVAYYQKQRAIANLIFCDKTKALLNNPPYSKEWWQSSNRKIDSLLATMQSEVGCKNL
jgi:hypothetical protein